MQIINRPKSGLQEFNEALQPYLQMAMQAMLKKKLEQPTEEREQAKEEREWISSVAKGEVSIDTMPEPLRKKVLRTQIVPSTMGSIGGGELQNMNPVMQEELTRRINSPTASVRGIPAFMSGIKQETPEIAQARLMSTYAQQQQAINPYKALGGQKLEARERIGQLVESGIPLEQVPMDLKIQAGYMSPIGSQTDVTTQILNELKGGTQTQNISSEPVPDYDPKTEKLMYSPSQKKFFKVKK